MSFVFPPATDSAGMPWPPGIYQVTLLNIEPDDRPSRFDDKPRAKWRFSVDKVVRLAPVADQAQRQENRAKAQKALNDHAELLAWCNTSMNRKATMRGWVEALLGKTIAVGEVANPRDVIGKSAEATLELYTGEDGAEKVKLTALAPLVEDDEDGIPLSAAGNRGAKPAEDLPF